MSVAHHKRGQARPLFSAVLALVLMFPAPALASHLPTDVIGDTPLSSGSIATSSAPDMECASGLLVTETGRAIWARGANDRRAMASITKLMTAILVLENAQLDEVVTISKAASEVDWAIGLQQGEQVTVGRLLEYLLVASSNDAAIALAEHVGGNIPAFVGLMNARAEKMGLANTHFVNPHGLDTPGHHSSSADIATLAGAAMEFDEVRRIVLLTRVQLPARGKRRAETIKATDELLGRFQGLLGGKTGFTDDAKYSFVAVAERDGVALTAVVLGARNNKARFAQTEQLLEWGFAHYAIKEVASADRVVARVKTRQNPAHSVPVALETTSAPVFDLAGEVTTIVRVPDAVRLPVFAGQPLGTAELRQGDRTLAEVPALAVEAVASAEETIGFVPVTDYLDRSVLARAGDVVGDVKAFDPNRPVERRVDLDEGVKAPIAVGDVVGALTYVQDGDEVATVEIVSTAAVEAPGFLEAIRTAFVRSWRKLFGGPQMAPVQLLG